MKTLIELCLSVCADNMQIFDQQCSEHGWEFQSCFPHLFIRLHFYLHRRKYVKVIQQLKQCTQDLKKKLQPKEPNRRTPKGLIANRNILGTNLKIQRGWYVTESHDPLKGISHKTMHKGPLQFWIDCVQGRSISKGLMPWLIWCDWITRDHNIEHRNAGDPFFTSITTRYYGTSSFIWSPDDASKKDTE